jgi:hypothetical protein
VGIAVFAILKHIQIKLMCIMFIFPYNQTEVSVQMNVFRSSLKAQYRVDRLNSEAGKTFFSNSKILSNENNTKPNDVGYTSDCILIA